MTVFNIQEGDCIEKMQSLSEDSVDVVVTSPPYNLDIAYSTYKDKRSDDSYLDWVGEWANEITRVLKPDGSFFLNLGGSLKKPLMPHRVIQELTDNLNMFVLQNTIHWVKSIAMAEKGSEQELQRGHYKPINSDRFLNDCHEYIFHLSLGGETKLDRKAIGIPYADKSNVDRYAGGSDLKCRGNTWFIPYKTICSRLKNRPHPSSFPVELAARCIKLHGNPEESVVMDPFLGIGNAATAAKECGVKEFVGFDIDPEYLEVARKVE